MQNQLDIALEELFVNVCRYAYADQDEPGEVSVDYVYNANPNAITVQITDHGVPFDPLTRKDPTRPASVQEATIGGLGIFMAKKSVDDFSYLRDGDSNVVACPSRSCTSTSILPASTTSPVRACACWLPRRSWPRTAAAA